MRDVAHIWDAWRSGRYVGENRPATRVTVQKGWSLATTAPTLGTWNRGPARWYQDADHQWALETELPNVVSVNIQRSLESDGGSCDIVITNALMPMVGGPEVPPGQFGEIGAFTFDHGVTQDARARWGHARNTWNDVLVPNALLRTYQGFGGHDKTVEQGLADGNLVLNGVWLVDDVTAQTDGTLSVKCRDIGKLLMDQQLFPPLVPDNLYPVRYERWIMKSNTIPADPPPSPIPDATYYSLYGFWDRTYALSADINNGWHSSTDEYYGEYNTGATGHPPSDAFDISYEAADAVQASTAGYFAHQWTYWLSEPKGSPHDWVWIEFSVEDGTSRKVNNVYYHPWAGNYRAQVSIFENGEWVAPQGGEGGMTAHGIPFVSEFTTDFDGDGPPGTATNLYPLPRDFNASRIRLTITNLIRAPEGGYRAGAKRILMVLNNQQTPHPVPSYAAASLPVSNANPPRMGYWQTRADGRIYAFGDARTYEANSPRNVPRGDLVAMAVHPTGEGYWTLDNTGRVLSYGLAGHHGDLEGLDRSDFSDIAPAPDGNGYWVLNKKGSVYQFGSAVFQGHSHHNGYLPVGVPAVAWSIESHPSIQGYWVLWTDGAVTNHNLPWHGNAARRPEMTSSEYMTKIVRNSAGTGYWVLSAGGTVQNFAGCPDNGSLVRGTETGEWFKALTWDLLPSSEDDKGYALQRADGHLRGLGEQKTFYFGDLGSGEQILRYPGNYFDYTDIVRELCLWSGLYLHRDDQPVAEFPDVFGNLENTGAWSDERLPLEMFDRKPVIESIKEIRDIVGYVFWIDGEGGVRFESPNWWTMGNFLIDGTPLTMMPEVDETVQMMSLSSTRSAQMARSELIIANSDPMPTEPGMPPTAEILVTRIAPRTKNDLRGLVVPAMWVNQAFLKAEEQKVMAELVDLRSWFGRRTTTTSCVANPLIDINDQVRLIERQTGEVFIHYVKGISISHDLGTGNFSMQLTTHWLGGSPYGVSNLYWAGAVRPQGDGYWTATFGGYTTEFGEAQPGIYAHGNAPLLDRNEADSHLTTIVAMRSTASGEGYFTLDRKGKVLTYGDAQSFGDAASTVESAADLALTPSGNGYWILHYDGTVRAFGDADFLGNAFMPAGAGSFNGLHAEAIESHPTDMGYWIMLSNGDVQPFDLVSYGGAFDPAAPTEFYTSLRRTEDGGGYFLLSSLGRVTAFGDAVALGDAVPNPNADATNNATWAILVNSTNGYAILHNSGLLESFNFAESSPTNDTPISEIEWAIATEQRPGSELDTSRAYVISNQLLKFLKSTSSPAATNAVAGGFGVPKEPTIKALTE